MSASAGSSVYRAVLTSVSPSVGRESKSCLPTKEPLSLMRSRIYRHSYLWAGTLLSRDFRYAATIAPGCCDDAAPDRRDPGRVLGRFEVLPCLSKMQELPQRRRGVAGHEHDTHAQDRPA